ncbi:hypothetical protein Ahy_A01g002758 isoform B [Arachis hypogaea]|uniref:TF-B3 domain-containing protein n=1 Tax=Arachis hypogaea TaxID=3818 RepID=A0A445ERD6_ARAHY|nr:hypothetical protein Ahy_A01g002758 isoform B [Arachis hypogaea]
MQYVPKSLKTKAPATVRKVSLQEIMDLATIYLIAIIFPIVIEAPASGKDGGLILLVRGCGNITFTAEDIFSFLAFHTFLLCHCLHLTLVSQPLHFAVAAISSSSSHQVLCRTTQDFVVIAVANVARTRIEDMTMKNPTQELVAKDIHGVEWKFKYIYRGHPKSYLLSIGWSAFVGQERNKVVVQVTLKEVDGVECIVY